MHRYEIIIYWSDADKVFVSEVPQLPGCAAHGNSYDEALNNCKEAIDHWITTAKAFGSDVPATIGRRLQLD
jgi:predicted RNase H-like HicB family nuclease